MASHKLKSPRDRRRDMFARIRRGMVAIVDVPDPPPGKPPDVLLLRIVASGFLVDNSGIVVTARHVFDPWVNAVRAGRQPSLPKVMFAQHGSETKNGDSFELEFLIRPLGEIRQSNTIDLAVAQIIGLEGIECDVLRLSDSFCGEGDVVAACGYPFGMDMHAKYMQGIPIPIASFTQGIVSAVVPHVDAPPAAKTVFQLDAMINGGNSGGPVFDLETGDVVGVVSERVHEEVHGVVTRPPNKQPATPGASPVEALHNLQVGIGRANIVHAHHVKPLIAELRGGALGTNGRKQ